MTTKASLAALAAIAILHLLPTPARACTVAEPCAGGRDTGFPFQRAGGAESGRGGAVVGHPTGCPGRAFCGCGASAYLFGHPVRNLYLAAAWLRFPRAAPAPRMAAARRHHVMVLLEHRRGDVWLVYDANSGSHATRIHERSIAGYAVVNPRA